MTTIRRFNTITLRPHPLQFVIDELILLVLCLLALGYGGTDGVFSELAVYAGLALLLYLVYKYIKLRRTVYTLSGEQLKKAEGSSQETKTISSSTGSLISPSARTSSRCSSA